jgi:hypothetical protein
MDKRGDSVGDGSDPAQRGLWRLMLRLPAMRGRLQILAAKSTMLKDLCEAYEEASLAVERLAKEGQKTSLARLAEYEIICEEIETDIVRLVLQQSRNVPD